MASDKQLVSLCECPTHLNLRIQEPGHERMPSYPKDSHLCFNLFLCLRKQTVTVASAGAITVAAAFSCHAFHCLETASRNNSFSRPFKRSHCFSLNRAALRGMHRATTLTHWTRTFFDFDSTPPVKTGGGNCFDLKRR